MNTSKYLIFALLSFCLLMAWYGDNTPVISLIPSPPTALVENVPAKSKPQVDSVWVSLSREFKLDHKAQSAQVKAEIKKLLAEPSKLYSILEAAEPYIYFIHKQTQAKGLPAEIALIPVIESEFNPNDHSNKGATGLWQLMPQTARELGVKVKSSYDGRRNVIASTKAALAYFNDLGNSFKGNWYLAIAAYNCGPVRITHAQHRTGQHSFWDLPLPRETKLYVPRLLAVAAIVKNPKKYGIELPHVNNAPYFAEVKTKKSVSLTQVSKSSDVSMETLRTLNPDYNHEIMATKGTYSLLVPINKAATTKVKFAKKGVVS